MIERPSTEWFFPKSRLNYHEANRLAEDEIHARIQPHIGPYFCITMRVWHCERTGASNAGYDCKIVETHTRKVLGLIEYKRRYNTRGRYPTWFIGLAKCRMLGEACREFGVPGCFAVQLDDMLGFVPLEVVVECERAECGRVDRGKNEKEKGFLVPWTHFDLLDETPPTVHWTADPNAGRTTHG